MREKKSRYGKTVRDFIKVFGGEEEDRTPDLCIANAALSQLSYTPNLLVFVRRLSSEGCALCRGFLKNASFSAKKFSPRLFASAKDAQIP